MGQATQHSDREREIAGHIAKGDYRTAIAMCTRDHEATLTELCITELGDNAEAREAVQEILVAAFDAMPGFDARQSLESWLLGIAHHICARHTEARAPKPEPSEMEKRVLAAVDARGPVPTPKPVTADKPPSGDKPPAGDKPLAADKPPAGERPFHQDITVPQTVSSKKPTLAVAAIGGMALAAFVGFVALRDSDKPNTVIDASTFDGALTAHITRVQHAGQGQPGVEVRASAQGELQPGLSGAVLGVGGAIRTDGRTRVDLSLSDRSTLHLDHNTEVALDPKQPRQLHVLHGDVVADIAHVEGAPAAQIITASGRIEVLGTKLFVSAQPAATNVRVTQGVVRLHSDDGSQSEVHPGQEAWLVKSGATTVSAAIDLASSMTWSEPHDDSQLRGLGELRARKPGDKSDKDRPLRLASHRVNVKIAGNLARTEVEESFDNDGPDELEGIYRFPLPPDAQIASLSLLVDGQWIEGGFVERDRAKKIWRGVIRNATPEQQRQQEEYIWVPGPWRDPALLEWQKGGQFELRIFPIPARGGRSVRIAYTELLPAVGQGRRYTYPLPHSADPKLRVGRFDANVRLVGAKADEQGGGTSYPMQRGQDGNASVLTFSEQGFTPAGDLSVDFRTHDSATELRSYAFTGQATAAAPSSSREGDPDAHREHQLLHADDNGYVAFVLRPSLPATNTPAARDFVIVVDASQSMVGERFARGSQLAARIVREMDPRDRALLLACDSTCRAMGTAPEAASQPLAQRVGQWLSSVEPAGGSDLVAALREAASFGQRQRNGRELHVVYIGDGNGTTGHRRASSIGNEVAALSHLPDGGAIAFTTIGIGSEADSLVLSAIARAGGGHYLPYRPGESLPVVALRMLESSYGAALRNPWLELPAGIDRVAPGALPTIRSGEEVVVVGRMHGERVSGEAVLHGELAGERYEKRIPINVSASRELGNAFVPTLWAQKTIEKLELDGRGEDVPRIIALSKAFAVMSRHTSLLVLESEAMFKAFGVDRAAPAATWTGDDEAEGESADPALDLAAALDGASSLDGLASSGMSMEGTLGTRAGGGSGSIAGSAIGGLGRSEAKRPEAAVRSRLARDDQPRSAPAPSRPASAAPAAEMAAVDDETPRDAPQRRMPEPEIVGPIEIPRPGIVRPTPMPLPPPPRGQWMRRVWVKTAEINADHNPRGGDAQAVAVAESALQQQPDSRDRHRSLVRALAKAGDLVRAEQVASAWIERDKLDAEALTYLSDVVGRKGDRDRALRLLSGVVDLRADDAVLHERLAKAFDRNGDLLRACAHRVSLAEIKSDSVADVATAVRCERNLGHATGARSVLDSLKDNSLRAKVEQAAQINDGAISPRGDLILAARWSAPMDLDLSLITNEGTRVSWMGGRVSAVGSDANNTDRETLGLSRVNAGGYRIEIARTDPSDRRPVSGEIEVRVLDQRRTLRFSLYETHAVVGRVRINRESRLVPSSAPRN